MNKLTIKDLAYMAVFAALIIALGVVAIPVGAAGVPIVLQNMGIILAALLLGCIRGGLTTVLFVGVGLVGVPNLAGLKPTLAALSGPTIGYIIGYMIAAFVVGYIAERAPKSNGARFGTYIGAGVVGILIMYICGSIGLKIRTGMDLGAAITANGPFIPGDALKVVAAAAIATAVVKAVPHLLPTQNTAAAPAA